MNGYSCYCYYKKIKAKDLEKITKDCKEFTLVPEKVASESAKLNIAKLKALPKETQIEVKLRHY